LTETSPAACINPVDLQQYNGYIGLPLPSTDAKIINDEGLEVPCDEPGELCIRGPQVMQGYWQQPQATEQVLSIDGWLRTGDVAIMTTDGFFKIVDRKKDMILVSGFNVYPSEIENLLVAHPDIEEVAAIGVPDSRSGEAIKLFVVERNPVLTKDKLMDYCQQKLTGYKQPKYITFLNELPKSNIGKVLRCVLRESHGQASSD
jgi:long-chain acyl-CoA synthetase